MGKQGEKFFLGGTGKHRRQADEYVAEVDPGIMAVTLAGGRACKKGAGIFDATRRGRCPWNSQGALPLTTILW